MTVNRIEDNSLCCVYYISRAWEEVTTEPVQHSKNRLLISVIKRKKRLAKSRKRQFDGGETRFTLWGNSLYPWGNSFYNRR
ncbi:hypothetical protein NIB75_00745 [Bacteroides uniformis]|nr:hypothetical protein [Bacteroides uniformis]